jgi:hypothetical protein
MADLFPMGFIDPIKDAMERNLNTDDEYMIVARPVGPLDPSRTVGIFPATWVANPEDKLIGVPNREPYQAVYTITIHNIVIHADPIEGRRLFGIDSKSIRAILYRDPEFTVALAGLTESFLGSVERVKKYDVLRQEYMSNKSGISFLYLCKTEFIITTETTQ